MSFWIDSIYYIPEENAKRLRRYTTYEQIFLGEHKDAFNPNLTLAGEDNMYITELFGQLISYTSADLLFGEPVTITSDDTGTEFLTEFYDAHPTFDTDMFEASLSNSYLGDLLVEMSLEDDKVKYNFVDPRHWIPTLDDMGEVTAHNFYYVLKRNDDSYVWQKIHYKGYIENKLWRVTTVDDKEVTEQTLAPSSFASIGMDVPDEQEGLADKFLVHHVPNMGLVNKMYGLSDYLGKESLMNSLNMLTSYATHILEKHADPAMEVPVGTLDPDALVYREDLKVFEVDGDTQGTARYVTWDGQLEALFKQREHVIDMLALYSELAAGILGKDTGGSIPESARAMQIKYARTLQKVARKRRYWERCILYMLETAQRLLGKEVSDYEVVFSDGLPEDSIDYLEEKMAERNLGVKSNDTLVKEVLSKQGWTNERIDEELERLNAHKGHIEGIAPKPLDLFKQTVNLKQGGNTTETTE